MYKSKSRRMVVRLLRTSMLSLSAGWTLLTCQPVLAVETPEAAVPAIEALMRGTCMFDIGQIGVQAVRAEVVECLKSVAPTKEAEWREKLGLQRDLHALALEWSKYSERAEDWQEGATWLERPVVSRVATTVCAALVRAMSGDHTNTAQAQCHTDGQPCAAGMCGFTARISRDSLPAPTK